VPQRETRRTNTLPWLEKRLIRVLLLVGCDSDDVSTVSVSNAGDVKMTSPSQKEEVLNIDSILPNKDPPEGKTTAIVAVMRDRPKHSHHRQQSNKHYKQKLVWVLLDSGSAQDLVFVNKDKPVLLPSLKKLVPQLWNTSNGMFQTKCKAEISLNIPIAKGTLWSLISLSMIRIMSHSMPHSWFQNHEEVWYHFRL
jgi:hypothetical protein